MTQIAIGQYYPVDSFIHRLDPRLKLLGVFALLTVLFLAKNPLSFGLYAVFLLAMIYASKVPLSFLFRSLRGILFILSFTVVLNIFLTPGPNILFQWGVVKVNQEGLALAAKMGARLVLLVLTSSMLTLTTSPLLLTSALEYLLGPFKKIGVPAHEIAMIMTIALRFIPTLLEEMDKIMKAQIARGADFQTGGIVQKARALIPLLVPLFISAFRRADELAMAMESRCYRGDVGRTSMKQLKMEPSDKMALGVLFGFVLVFLATVFL